MIPFLIYFCVAVSYVGGITTLAVFVAILFRLARAWDSICDGSFPRRKPKNKGESCNQKKQTN
jgi:hypothetical protein